MSLVFLNIGSEPVRGRAIAEDPLRETARPQLAWLGGKAPLTLISTRVRVLNNEQVDLQLPIRMYPALIGWAQDGKEAHRFDNLLLMTALEVYSHRVNTHQGHHSAEPIQSPVVGQREKFLKPRQYDQRPTEKLGRYAVTDCRNEI